MRQKAYYTENEIETNLYTTGKEFMLRDRTEYIGLYHRYIITGEIYTLATWDKNKSKPLIIYQELDPAVVTYKNAKPKIRTKYNIPVPYKVVISPADKKTGNITRYFIKKINNQNIIEINEKQFKDFNNKKIDPNLYIATSLTWHITGEINDTKQGGMSVIGVRTKNKNSVDSANESFPGLNKYLDNLTEFHSDVDFIVAEDINQR